MKFKKLLVSEDNQLVLSDFGLDDQTAQIVDLNQDLLALVNDQDLVNFIFESVANAPDKVYLFCVKENFKNNTQDLMQIPDIKQIYKAIKKLYKPLKNTYFFVYNTYLKNDKAIDSKLDQKGTFGVNEQTNEIQINSEYELVGKPIDPVKDNEVNQEDQADDNEQEVNEPTQPLKIEKVDLYTQTEEQLAKEAISTEFKKQLLEEDLLQNPFIETELAETKKIPVTQQEVDLTTSSNEEGFLYENPFAYEDMLQRPENGVLDTANFNLQTDQIPEKISIDDINETIFAKKKPVEETEFDLVDEAYFEQQNKASFDERIRQSILESQKVDNSFFDEFAVGVNETNLDKLDIENITVEKQALINPTKADGIVGKDEVKYPDSYFENDVDEIGQDNNLSYDDYEQVANDYELSTHSLKSIYDFIWRALIVNNSELRINDLLYITISNLSTFSPGQSDFLRQVAKQANSLFDLILQLDIKLEFNNSLFYIFLAQFFILKGNRIFVNEKFLETLSIWIKQKSKEKFIAQVQQFMNYATVYNKKIIFSYFIELANLLKASLPIIRSNLALIDLHRLITKSINKWRSENVFGIIINKVIGILAANDVVVELYLVKTPENMFGFESNQIRTDNTSWKTQLALLYKKLLENFLNYITLKGNNENAIFNIYIDIKDLRMHKYDNKNKNLLSPQTAAALNQNVDSGSLYFSIDDELPRADEANVQQTDTQNVYQPTITNKVDDKYSSYFSFSEFENSISKRIDDYEQKIKNNIARIEAERKQLRLKIEALKNNN